MRKADKDIIITHHVDSYKVKDDELSDLEMQWLLEGKDNDKLNNDYYGEIDWTDKYY